MNETPFEVLVTVKVTGTTTPQDQHSVLYRDVTVLGANPLLNANADAQRFAEGVVKGLINQARGEY